MNQPIINKLVSQGLLTAAVGVVGAVVLATMPVPAFSATTAAANPRAQYARDVAHCRTLAPKSTDRANCLSEASTRFSMTQPSKPQESADILARNALRRCDTLPPADKTECVARMQHGTASGSIAGGGVLRQLVTREVVTDPAALPPTAAGPASGVPAAPPVTVPAPRCRRSRRQWCRRRLRCPRQFRRCSPVGAPDRALPDPGAPVAVQARARLSAGAISATRPSMRSA